MKRCSPWNSITVVITVSTLAHNINRNIEASGGLRIHNTMAAA
ncbi:MAG TPA: hypothetical protein VH639_05055 [Bryobacteraceae bacterium]|jgi:hypothetical protein